MSKFCLVWAMIMAYKQIFRPFSGRFTPLLFNQFRPIMKKLFLLLPVFFVFASCLSDPPPPPPKEKDKTILSLGDDKVKIEIEHKDDLKKALNDLGDAIRNLNVDVNVEQDSEELRPVSASDLQKVLPRRIGWIKQTESSAEKSGALGLSVGTAKAVYEDDDQRIEVTVVDGGGVGALLSKIAGLSKIELDKVYKDGGYERISEIDGQRVIEKYEPEGERYELVGGAHQRFLISIKGTRVSLRKLKSAFSDIADDLE
ncbi:MAG: hypothetical protein D6714_08915, partial [Bacteroidetes bacterium]